MNSAPSRTCGPSDAAPKSRWHRYGARATRMTSSPDRLSASAVARAESSQVGEEENDGEDEEDEEDESESEPESESEDEFEDESEEDEEVVESRSPCRAAQASRSCGAMSRPRAPQGLAQ